jgi:hypothetical protein
MLDSFGATPADIEFADSSHLQEKAVYTGYIKS